MNLLKWKENLLRKTLAVITALIIVLPINGQDRLARTGPVDRKSHIVDSIEIRRLKIIDEFKYPSNELYGIWTNSSIRYNKELPEEYKIDLRGFHMPCDSRKVTSHFGYRPKFGRNHYGVDIKVYVGDTIRAAFSGKVRIVAYEANGFGNYVVIRHSNGLETYYGHMSKQLVKPNQEIKAGTPIGLGGNTGRSTGSHLHFETRLLGKCINPENMFDFAFGDRNADFYIFKKEGNGELYGNVVKRKKEGNATNEKIFVVTKDNETLASISKKVHKTIEYLCQINGLKNNEKLHKSQILKY